MADRPFHNPFAGLADLSGVPAPAPEQTPGQGDGRDATDATMRTGVRGPARAVVRMERAGRGGKTVTVVDHLGLQAPALADWLQALKGALGCGGVVEDGRIVLQGDHRDRVPELLRARGVRKVTAG